MALSSSWRRVMTLTDCGVSLAEIFMPVAVDMAQLYAGLLGHVMPLRQRAGESLADWVVRTEQAGVLQREVARLQGRVAKEKQFRRRVDLNAELRKLRIELNGLR